MSERRRGGRGWGVVVGLSLIAAALSVVHPALLIFVPLSLLLLALPPRRPPLLLLGLVLGAVMFAGREAAGPLWYVERGWVLLLGGWFLGLAVLAPGWTFLSRSLAAVGGAVVSGALLLLPNGAWRRLDWTMEERIRGAASEAAAAWGGSLQPPLGTAFVEAMHRVADLQALLYPALLGLGSVAALAVAWWAHRRLAALEERPLGSLREFRFRDDLVWLLIAGIGLVLLPLGDPVHRAGSNLLVFMGALYALRGLGVILVLVGSVGALGVALGVAALVFLYPLVLAATLLLGLTDTWVDLRARAKAKA